MTAIAALVAWWVVVALGLALGFRGALRRAWAEPVLAAPVLIIESDDWGYGPLVQVRRLQALAECLGRHRDARGRHPVLGLGLVLAGPDVEAMRERPGGPYLRLALDAPPLQPVRAAIDAGVAEGVFCPLLHGHEHFWPATLEHAARADATLERWLRGAALPMTETLPPALQSRWIDARGLPSEPLPDATVRQAVRDEVAEYRRLFGAAPAVVVPPTFVWTGAVEAAWAEAGVACVVTPGRRLQWRDGDGRPAGPQELIRNGDRGPGGLVYLVRDAYFEPARGHRAEQALAALAVRTRCGRPTLLETHRINFIGEDAVARHALEQVDALYRRALLSHPRLRFLSTAELALQYRDGGELIEPRGLVRLRAVLYRMAGQRWPRRLAWMTGLALPLALLMWERRGGRANGAGE